MHSDDEVDAKSNESGEQPSVTKLVSADQVKSPEVQTWQFMNLEQEQKKQEQKIRSEVYRQIQRELEPQISKQTAILKKEAYEEAKQAGYEDGYQAGFETGQAQGIEKAQQTAKETLEPQVARLTSILDQMAQPQREITALVFKQLAEVSLMLAEKLVEEVIEADSTRIIRFVEEAVAKLPDPDAQITLELNPEDLSVIEYYQKQHGRHWRLIANSNLEAGTCRAKSLSSVVNHNWKQNLNVLFDQTQYLITHFASETESEQPTERETES